MFNIFADPLDPKSNSIGIYASMGLASKLFVNQNSLSIRVEELKIQGINIEFECVTPIKRPYNNLSAYAVAVAYPEFCKKYWADKGEKVEKVIKNKAKFFDDVIRRIQEARKYHEENVRMKMKK